MDFLHFFIYITLKYNTLTNFSLKFSSGQLIRTYKKFAHLITLK
jgi:hypothetical protein